MRDETKANDVDRFACVFIFDMAQPIARHEMFECRSWWH